MIGHECKRMKVTAIGYKKDLIEIKENLNMYGGCKNEEGACGCTHAEIRLLEVMPNPELVVVSHAPCFNCAKALLESGVKVIRYVKPYRLTKGIEYLKLNGVIVKQITI